MKIEFAANGRQMEGWICTDINTCDVRKPLPWPDRCASQLYASHLAEHLTSAECMRFFMECHRILLPGGVFRVVVPAIGLHMERVHVKDLCMGHAHFQTFSFENLRAMLYGAGFDVANIRQVERSVLDNHHETIGEAKDYAESLRVEAMK